MTEQQLRQKVADKMTSWVGATKGSAKHAEILKIYNDHRPLARGYKMKVNDAYCAATVSAAFIAAGIAQYTGTECGVEKFARTAQDKGIWVENDAHVPKLGDAVVYDWQDTGVGDCTGAGDHIGIVTKPGATSFVVTEGNMTGGKTGTRTLQVNGRYIRGFITPDYAAIAKALGGAAIPTDTAPDTTGKSIEEIAREVIAGKWGSGTDRRNRLQAAGYAYTTVQAKVNEILGKGTAQAGTAYTVGKNNEETFFNFCRQVLGLNVAGAVGATANVARESNFQTGALGDGGTSFGICQWHAGRYTNLKNWCSSNGKDYKTMDGQLWYMKYELEHSYSAVLQYIRSVPNTAAGAHDAAARWCMKYEIPANTAATAEARGALARDTYWPKYSGTGAAAAKPTTPASTKVVSAEKFDRSLAGTYIVTPNIGANIRLGPSTAHGIIKAVSKGTKVSNYGYYSIRGGVKWYYIRLGATVGFISSTCLKKI